MYNYNTPLWQLTVGEFLEVMERAAAKTPGIAAQASKDNKQIVYGIKGISKLFNCSLSSAQKIKSSGLIDKAIIQIGRKIIVNAELALELASQDGVKP